MKPGIYFSRPVQIEAIQFLGHNAPEVKKFASEVNPEAIGFFNPVTSTLVVNTNHGPTTAEPMDWIIKSSKGEFYPCKSDVFAEKYEDDKPEETDETKDFVKDGDKELSNAIQLIMKWAGKRASGDLREIVLTFSGNTMEFSARTNKSGNFDHVVWDQQDNPVKLIIDGAKALPE